MNQKRDLLKSNISKIEHKQWYHQRFDGCPYFICIIADNELQAEKRKQKYGGNHTTRVCFFNNDRADWYILMNDIEMTTKKILELAKTEPSLSKKLLKEWVKDEKAFDMFCKEVDKINLTKLTNNQLIKLHDKFYKLASKRFTSSSIIDGFALGSDEIIADKVMSMLKQKGLESNFPTIFSKLTAPIKQSFINEAEISLLKVAKLIFKNKELKKCIEKKGTGCVDKLQEFTEENKAMKKHIKNYYWSKNNYVQAYYLDEKHWLEEIQDMIKHNLNIEEQIDKILSTPRKNKYVKMELMKTLKISKYLKTLLTISEDLTWWQDERKRATYWNINLASKILDEIRKRTGYSLHEVKYMVANEVSRIFEDPIPLKEVQKRMKSCAITVIGNKYEFVTENKVNELKKIIEGIENLDGIKEFKGLCASPGKITGKVKICKSSTEVGKVNKGDILVAVMTRPDYVIGMKKAAAIVTNEGGVTSHAAIVTREIGIPCIIGTKIATEVLKDGDEIEVDATEGTVRILKKKA